MSRTTTILVVLSWSALLGGCSKDPEVAKREFLQSGDSYVAQQKFREAIIEYRNAVSADPRFGEARLKLADVYAQVQEPQNAYREYIRAADLLPNDLTAQLKAGQILLLTNQFEDAKARADKALAIQPKDVEAHILKGHALAGLRDLEGAVSQIEQAIKDRPDHGLSYSNLGALQQVQGDVAAAEKSFLQAVATDAKSTKAHLALANFYWSTNRRQEAEKALEAALALAPTDLLTNRALALLYLASGRDVAAEKRFKAVADADPTTANRLALADFYTGIKRFSDAIAVLENVSKDADGFVPAQLRLAALSVARGDPGDASRRIDAVLAKDERHVEALGIKAELRMNEGKLDEALQAARASLGAGPGVARAHLLLGRILALQNDREGAVKAYEDALRLDPRLVGAAVELAKARLESAKPDEAVQLAQSALQRAPGNLDARLVLARGQLAKGDLSAAEESLGLLATDVPHAAVVQLDLGRLYLAKGNAAAARRAFERAWSADQTQIAALEGLAILDVRENKPQQALARVEAAIASAPTVEGLHILAGRLYASSKDNAAAEGAFKKALAINPNSLRAYAALGQFYAAAGRLPEATVEYEQLVAKQPKSVGVVTTLGLLLQMQNRGMEAQKMFEKALELDPRASVAANNLAWILAEQGQELDRALQLAQTAKAELPNMPEVSDTLGWVYYKKGLVTLAIPQLRESVEKDATNALYQFHLGLAYAKSGDLTSARQALQRALDLKLPAEHVEEAKRVLATVA